jgi:hypothetical protein
MADLIITLSGDQRDEVLRSIREAHNFRGGRTAMSECR